MKQKIDVSNFWRFLSSFFDLLDDATKAIWEFFWEGEAFVANELNKAAARFLFSSSPERSYVNPTIDYYDIKIDILTARPIQFDSTSYGSRYILISKSIIFSEPSGSGRDPIRNDMIQVSREDYTAIHDVALNQYIVINPNDPGIPVKYFRIMNLKSPEDSGDNHYDKYVIQLSNANLAYIPQGSKTTIYITTGRAFTIEDYVIDMPMLWTTIADQNNDGSSGPVFTKDVDYTFKDHYLEFNRDMIGDGIINNGDYVYGKNIPIMEFNLYNSFGTLVSVPNWSLYNHDNISGKAALNSLIKAVQNPSNQEEYQRALNVYYGLPVAPENSEILGLFESYDYEVIAIDYGPGNRWITLSIKSGTVLHSFIQPGTKFIIDGSENIVNVVYDAVESNVINRVSAQILINDITNLSIGSVLNIKLTNRLSLVHAFKPPADSLFRTLHYTDGGEFNHIASYTSSTYNKLPEMLIYNSNSLNGYYHINSCNPYSTGYVSFVVDDYTNPDFAEPRYNDYVNLNVGQNVDLSVGYVHVPWPTHKYLLLKFDDGTLYKCYIDSPIDTIYETGDRVDRYQVVSRCVSVCDQRTFQGWNEFDGFRRHNGIDLNSNMLELIYTIPNTKYGIYMPN